jgi:hypothetical protein
MVGIKLVELKAGIYTTMVGIKLVEVLVVVLLDFTDDTVSAWWF